VKKRDLESADEAVLLDGFLEPHALLRVRIEPVHVALEQLVPRVAEERHGRWADVH
jgi:hypothetical protein